MHLVVTAADAADLAATHVFLGNDYSIPYSAVSADGVRDARYADGADDEVSTPDCLVYDGSELVADTPVVVSGNSYSADLPKGDVISFESTGVAVGIVGIGHGLRRTRATTVSGSTTSPPSRRSTASRGPRRPPRS